MAKKILVADDEPYVLRSIEYTLSKAGYNVVTAVDGEEAYTRINAENPDLVFLDIQMPKMDGNSVCKKLREDPEKKDLYIIVITAKGQESERLFSLECGASEYITKPYSPRKMLERVKEILGE
ncbi:MAG: response regulator [Armatimonadetes bacterium]|nr:response regulator [Armatimonadota bacterium]